MAFVLRSFSAKHILSLSTIIALSTANLTPLHSVELQGYSSNVINLAACGVRVKSLVDKMNKYKDSQNLDKLVECMLDIKQEAEYATGKATSIGQLLDYAQSEMKARGKKIGKPQMEAIKKYFKKKESKRNHKVWFMAECIQNGLVYDADLEQAIFEAKHTDVKDPGIILPLGLSIGITCCVCGGVLMMIPIPFCREIGGTVLFCGSEMLFHELVLNPALEQDKKNRMLVPIPH